MSDIQADHYARKYPRGDRGVIDYKTADFTGSMGRGYRPGTSVHSLWIPSELEANPTTISFHHSRARRRSDKMFRFVLL